MTSRMTSLINELHRLESSISIALRRNDLKSAIILIQSLKSKADEIAKFNSRDEDDKEVSTYMSRNKSQVSSKIDSTVKAITNLMSSLARACDGFGEVID